ncbi:hypothetical protein AAMO2058_000962200 [Amorphochlora amoebiformis]|eukprot:1320990-Amorphochlora_amoeboformis.AAC.1
MCKLAHPFATSREAIPPPKLASQTRKLRRLPRLMLTFKNKRPSIDLASCQAINSKANRVPEMARLILMQTNTRPMSKVEAELQIFHAYTLAALSKATNTTSPSLLLSPSQPTEWIDRDAIRLAGGRRSTQITTLFSHCHV